MADKDQKAPAFQFYPRDWDTDELVIPMTYEEEGVYWALCRRYWLAGNTLPADLDQLRVLLKGHITKKKMEALWTRVGRCFKVVEGHLTHKRLDRERAHQQANKAKRQKAAEERWKREEERKAPKPAHASPVQMQNGPPDDALQCTASASSTATATATAAAAEEQPPPLRPLPPGPRLFDRQHASHVFGFCDWVCLPAFLFNEFIAKGGGEEGRVEQWAKGIRREWHGRDIGDNLKFWRERWNERATLGRGADPSYDAADARVRRQIAEDEERRRRVLS